MLVNRHGYLRNIKKSRQSKKLEALRIVSSSGQNSCRFQLHILAFTHAKQSLEASTEFGSQNQGPKSMPNGAKVSDSTKKGKDLGNEKHRTDRSLEELFWKYFKPCFDHEKSL